MTLNVQWHLLFHNCSFIVDILYCSLTCTLFFPFGRVSDPFTEIPADMLLFQICIPFAIEHFKLRTTIKSLLRYWFTAVGWALGLTDFLLPRPEDNAAQENGNVEPGRQDRLQVQLGVQDQALVALPGGGDPNGSILASGDSNVAEEYDTDEQSDSE